MTKNNKTIYVSRDIPALWFGTYRVPIWESNSDVIEQIIEEKNFTNIEDVENLILEKNYITLDDVDTVVGPQGVQGAQGETGAQGAKGDRGYQGEAADTSNLVTRNEFNTTVSSLNSTISNMASLIYS